MKRVYSTLDIARLLGVAPGSVANWVDRKNLKAGRTPGGHRRVLAGDLIDFLRRHRLPIPAELGMDTCKVLVVDDEPRVAAWLAETILASFTGCEVFQAHDGFAAGEVVGSQRPGVVLLDLRMPGLDGFEVCRRIKADPATRDMVVLAMTGNHSPAAEKRILQCGAKICLRKPIDLPTLLKELSSALGRDPKEPRG